jgi:putative transposase
MAFWKCFYHVVWTTKQRAPLITPPKEILIYRLIEEKSSELDGHVMAVNGTADHVHVALALHPKTAVANWVKRCKGATSYAVNQMFPNDEHFYWQGGYGVLSYGTKQIDFVVDYVKQQKEHHTNRTLNDFMERVDDEED